MRPPGRRRIAYYTWSFPSETFIRREVDALRRAGLDVVTFAHEANPQALLDDDGRRLQASTGYPFPVERARARRWHLGFLRRRPRAYLALLAYVISRRYATRKSFAQDLRCFHQAVCLAGLLVEVDADHIHSPWADYCGWISLLSKRLLGIPFSVQGRAYDLHRTTYYYRRAGKHMFRGARFIITNSEYNRGYIEPRTGRDRAGVIHTIYNGLDLATFEPTKGDWALRSPVRLLCVARFIEPKGLTYLLEACRLLKDGGLAFVCDVIGGPELPLYSEYWENLVGLHADLGLEDCVAFHDEQPFSAILSAYRAADIFVLPCVEARNGHRDITPNALMEAMAMRLPVIATRMTAIPEIVEHEVSGLLVPPRDPKALQDAILRMIEDAELRQRLGENGRRKVDQRFDVERNAARYVKLFQGG
jgi:colanic acid/amylovoran biosynthesis glycosyltransferase